jgi:hypothetical protein
VDALENSTTYKSSMGMHIISVIVRAFIVFVPLNLLVGILQDRILIFWQLGNLFGGWDRVLLFLFLCALVFSVISLKKHRIKITVDNNGVVTMLYGNGAKRSYSLSNTIFAFQKEAGGIRFRFVAFEWVIEVTDIHGNTEKIYAYAFSKRNFYKLVENIEELQREVYVESASDWLECKWRLNSCNYHCRQ